MIRDDGPEHPLLGGDLTVGIVRVGDTVRRPRIPESDLVEPLLLYLEEVGFAGAPRFLGVDSSGRQALSYLDGEVAGRPWPDWVADDERIASVARLLRTYDDAVQPFGVPVVADVTRHPIPEGMPPLSAGPSTFIGHMDICPENVVFIDERAAALIDFDLARPTNRLREVCNMLLWWAPLMPIADREGVVQEVDPFARAALMVNEYGLSTDDRARLVAAVRNSADRTWFAMRSRAQRSGGAWQQLWDQGIGDRILRRQHWLADHTAHLHSAVTAS